jgi:DNA-binding protein H-NS
MPQEWKTAAKVFRWKERVDLYDGERIRELLENERQERDEFRAFSKEMLWEALKKIKSTFKKLNEETAEELSWHSAVMATSTLLPLMERIMSTSAAPELPGSKKGKPLAVKMYLPASDGQTISPRNWLDELPEDDDALVMNDDEDPAKPEPVENA